MTPSDATPDRRPPRRRRRLVSAQRSDGWEPLREVPITSLVADSTGISSGPTSANITGTG